MKLPPLECLFTVDEETGLTGAFGLDASLLTGAFRNRSVHSASFLSHHSGSFSQTQANTLTLESVQSIHEPSLQALYPLPKAGKETGLIRFTLENWQNTTSAACLFGCIVDQLEKGCCSCYCGAERMQTLCAGRTMLNLDTEDWTEIFIGCAGGGDSILTLPIATEAAAAGSKALQLSITGMRSAQPHKQLGCSKPELC